MKEFDEFLKSNPDVALRFSLFGMQKVTKTMSNMFRDFSMAIARAHILCPNLRCDQVLIDRDEYTLVVAESLADGFSSVN